MVATHASLPSRGRPAAKPPLFQAATLSRRTMQRSSPPSVAAAFRAVNAKVEKLPGFVIAEIPSLYIGGGCSRSTVEKSKVVQLGQGRYPASPGCSAGQFDRNRHLRGYSFLKVTSRGGFRRLSLTPMVERIVRSANGAPALVSAEIPSLYIRGVVSLRREPVVGKTSTVLLLRK